MLMKRRAMMKRRRMQMRKWQAVRTVDAARQPNVNFDSCEATAAAAAMSEKEPQDEDKAKRPLYCSLCKVSVNSPSQLQAHNSGAKHKTMLEAKSGDGAIQSFPRVGGSKAKTPQAEPAGGLRHKTFRCHICDVHVNSDTQLKQHISSRRHKDRAAGKVSKPKFKPYARRRRRLHTFQTKNHDRPKPAAALAPAASSLLHDQLAAAMSSLPSFPVRPASGPAFFHVSPLPQALRPLVFPHD